MTTGGRERNRRGEGAKLRDDILIAAAALLEQTGSEESVTLRAVARAVGISAPSIYAHFPDREAIVDAIVDQAFEEFSVSQEASISSIDDPVERLRAGCADYLRFARERPSRYRIIFGRRDLLAIDAEHPAPAGRTANFMRLVRNLQACIDAGASASTDAFGDSAAIWVGLHGYATLHAGLAGFPWPPEDAMFDRIVMGLGRIDVPDGASRAKSQPALPAAAAAPASGGHPEGASVG
jgi:AcrR family transcriptional regulator